MQNVKPRSRADPRGGAVLSRLQAIAYDRRVNFFQLLLPDFSLILLGYLVCRYTALDRTVWQQVESLVYFFL